MAKREQAEWIAEAGSWRAAHNCELRDRLLLLLAQSQPKSRGRERALHTPKNKPSVSRMAWNRTLQAIPCSSFPRENRCLVRLLEHTFCYSTHLPWHLPQHCFSPDICTCTDTCVDTPVHSYTYCTTRVVAHLSAKST